MKIIYIWSFKIIITVIHTETHNQIYEENSFIIYLLSSALRQKLHKSINNGAITISFARLIKDCVSWTDSIAHVFLYSQCIKFRTAHNLIFIIITTTIPANNIEITDIIELIFIRFNSKLLNLINLFVLIATNIDFYTR